MLRVVASMGSLCALAAVALAGCYESGSVASCAVSCDLSTTCPGGLACNAEGLCSAGGASCGGGTARRLTIAITGPGLVELDGNTTCDARAGDRACVFDLAEGAAVDLLARPAPGNELLGWGPPCGAAPACSLTLDADTVVEVGFGQAGARFVSVSLVGGDIGNAMVRSSPPGLDCPPTCGEIFPPGTDPITLSPVLTGEPRWREDPASWSGCDREDAGTCVITSPGAIVAAYRFIRTPLVSLMPATFTNQPVPYVVSRLTNPIDCTGSSMCADRFDEGTAVSFMLVGNVGVRLESWVATGATIVSAGNANPFTVTVGDQDVTVEPRLTSMGRVNTVCGPATDITSPVSLACGPNGSADGTFPVGGPITITGTTRPNHVGPSVCQPWTQAADSPAFTCEVVVALNAITLTLP